MYKKTTEQNRKDTKNYFRKQLEKPSLLLTRLDSDRAMYLDRVIELRKLPKQSYKMSNRLEKALGLKYL
jgi:hypothetical protein